jgi:hypothetical protein
LALLFSCDNTLDVIAPYQDNTVLYCLLDQTDSVHYAKVGKSFLGEGNAYDMAQQFDSLYYGPEVKVYLENKSTNQSFEMERVLDSHKDSGIFHYPDQILYRLEQDLNEDHGYRIRVVKGDDKDDVTGETRLIQEFFIKNPRQNTLPLSFVPSLLIDWDYAEYAKVYEVRVYFSYLEVNKLDPSDSILKTVDWLAGVHVSPRTDGSGGYDFEQSWNQIATRLANMIPVDETVVRYARTTDVIFSVAAEEYYTFVLANGPSLSINQSNAEYTNVQNGLGLVSSRYNQGVYGKYLHNFHPVSGTPLSSKTVDSLALSPKTCDLNFAYYRTNTDPNNPGVDTLFCN